MTCKEFDKIQAFIDSELPREDRKQFSLHLEECKECQDNVSETKQLDQWCDMHIENSLSESDSTTHIDINGAWQRFQKIVKEPPVQHAEQIEQLKGKWGKNMKKSTKRWIVTAASIAILGGGLAIPQVQSIASEFLSVFRLDRVEFVKLTQEDVNKVKHALSYNKNGSFDLKGLGSIHTESNGKDQYLTVSSAKKEGISIPKLPSGATLNSVSTTAPRKLQMTLNTEKANQLLQQLKVSNVQLSRNLNNKTFTVHTPEVRCFDFNKNGKNFSYTTFSPPRIEVENGVNVDEIRNIILALPFIPNSIKDKFVNPTNWKNTLLIPVLGGDTRHVKEIRLNGIKVIEQTGEYSGALTWQKDGDIRILRSNDQQPNSELLRKMVTELN